MVLLREWTHPLPPACSGTGTPETGGEDLKIVVYLVVSGGLILTGFTIANLLILYVKWC